MTDLHTSYLGLHLRSPLVASASPLTGHVDFAFVGQLRVSGSHQAATDPTGFERANYLRTLASYRLTPVL